MAKTLSGLPGGASKGVVLVGRLVDGAVQAVGKSPGALTKAKRQRGTALDRALAALEPLHPAGLRAPLHEGAPLDREISKAAHRNNPQTNYDLHRYPADDELAALCRFRFSMLDAYHRGAWDPKHKGTNPAAEEAMQVCAHPTVDCLISAFGVLYANRHLRTRNSRALRSAWRRDLEALRSATDQDELSSTEDFSAHYGPLIAQKGVLGAVVRVLEQAFELERTVEYVAAHLADFQSITGSKSAKGLAYGEHDPNLIELALSRPADISSGDWAGHARLNASLLDRIELDHHQADPPEGKRWHLILGRPPLHFILHYLFQAHDRFAPYVPVATSDRFNRDSAFLRVAINMLAHIDAAEAQAELVARISHSRQNAVEGPLHVAIPREQFDVFSSDRSSKLTSCIDEFDWAARYICGRRSRYDRLVGRGLTDEERNPFARAFPCPQAWSSPGPTAALERVWRDYEDPLARLDLRYAPRGSRGKHPLSELKATTSLELAAKLIETPNPMSKARSLGRRSKGKTLLAALRLRVK